MEWIGLMLTFTICWRHPTKDSPVMKTTQEMTIHTIQMRSLLGKVKVLQTVIWMTTMTKRVTLVMTSDLTVQKISMMTMATLLTVVKSGVSLKKIMEMYMKVMTMPTLCIDGEDREVVVMDIDSRCMVTKDQDMVRSRNRDAEGESRLNLQLHSSNPSNSLNSIQKVDQFIDLISMLNHRTSQRMLLIQHSMTKFLVIQLNQSQDNNSPMIDMVLLSVLGRDVSNSKPDGRGGLDSKVVARKGGVRPAREMTNLKSLMLKIHSLLNSKRNKTLKVLMTSPVPNSLRRVKLGARSHWLCGEAMDKSRGVIIVKCVRISGFPSVLLVLQSLSVISAPQFVRMGPLTMRILA